MGGFSTIGGGASAREVWEYATRTLTQQKYGFWSGIITLQRDSQSVPASTTVYISIQPPPGEVWWVSVYGSYDFSGSNLYLVIESYNGSSFIYFTPSNYTLGTAQVHVIMTNSLWVRIRFQNNTAFTYILNYHYSGFKLSNPLWAAETVASSVSRSPDVLRTDTPLPKSIAPLQKYARLVLGLDPDNPNRYVLAVALDEDLPLQRDSKTGFPVVRRSAYIRADVLAKYVEDIRRGTVSARELGLEEYLERWAAEGIRLL